MDLRDRTVLVTGGGRGLGAAFGQAAARAGARVVLVARTAAEVEAVASAIRAGGRTAHAIVADIGDDAAATAIASAAAALAGPVDVLVHNASVLGPVPLRPLLETAPADFARALSVNLLGPLRLSQAVLGSMVLRGQGLVLHVTSDAGVEAYPGWGAYGVSKAALDHLARIWAAELPDVRFLSVDPGEMRTRMHAEAMPDADEATLADPAAVAESLLELIRDAERLPERLAGGGGPLRAGRDAVKAATAARAEPATDRLLVVRDGLADRRVDDLPELLRKGDVVVVNDAATLPASLRGHDAAGVELELRLLGVPAGEAWPALLFGSGDWRTQTEDRARPPEVAVDDVLRFADGLAATVTRVWPESPRLVDVRFDRAGAPLLSALYAQGRPVQYAYLPEPLALRSFQTPFASRPWAAEMPSAGRVLTAARLLALRRAGIEVASLTHAAGLSSTGEPALDALLPLPEPYDMPAATARAIGEARARAGRVIAAGTTVVRALESATANGGVVPGMGVAQLRIDGTHTLRSVDAVLTGMHEPGSSHFELLRAFASAEVLARAHARAEAEGYLAHEFGDSMLVWGR